MGPQDIWDTVSSAPQPQSMALLQAEAEVEQNGAAGRQAGSSRASVPACLPVFLAHSTAPPPCQIAHQAPVIPGRSF